ncbi:hypothetical protein EX895_004307 [Sporisorium graminicola]|uniref:Uncharacterized protein n=1 Tax=Sporisorium graminicola TaxID=280036 RepID=A0A4U7KRS9_9BASI|nr:hypothetical protein EX895_004307 [Sporisorium graminicola]TKY86667.1 hypothetical protein EX895_004307 [Sporisorium graminicola]
MSSLRDDGFEVVGVTSSGIQRPIRAPRTRAAIRKSTRTTKLPSIPKADSPSQQPEVEAVGLNAGHPSKRKVTSSAKRRRSISDASRSSRGRSASHDEERDELEEGPSRKYKKPSNKASKASPSKAQDKSDAKAKGKGKGADKEPKPKKITKAGLERAKLDELRSDEHFGKLDDGIIKRIAKVHLERMYLIHRFRNGEQLREEFDVSGSKGNVYKVVIDRSVSCSCMDFSLRRQVCKHLLFVYIKVLRLEGHLPVYSRIRLSADEVDQVFDEALENPVAQALAKPELRKAWETAVGYQSEGDDEVASGSGSGTGSNRDEAPAGKRLVPEEGDVCGVCYEDLEPGSIEGLEFCLESCGRPIHTDCLETWFNTRGFNRTCIWCRAIGAVVDASGRQLNLAAAAGLNEPVNLEPAAEAVGGEDYAAGWEGVAGGILV